MPVTPSSVRDSRSLGVPAALAALALVSVVSRLPILTSPQTYMDGDEALMGLAVRNALAGEGIPLFPPGAAFGLSFLETGLATAMAAVFGLSETLLNVSIFLLWVAGAACLVAAAHRFVGGRAAWWAAALAVATPAWLHFSNVSWGYYHSAFLFCHATLFATAVAGEDDARRLGLVAGIGSLASLTYYTQPIFALGLVPFLGWLIVRRRRVDDVVVLACAFAVWTGVYLLVRNPAAYWAPATFANVDVVHSLTQMPQRLWGTATGVYFLNRRLAMGPLTEALTYAWVLLVAGSAVLAVVRTVRSRTIDVSVVALASTATIVAFSLVVDRYQWGFRYLLPTVGFHVLVIANEARFLARSTRLRQGVSFAAGAFVALSLVVAWTEVSRVEAFSGSVVESPASERDALRMAAERLEARGVRHVYSWGGMLQWKLMFETDGRVLARWVPRTDRMPAYPPAVDAALERGDPVAIFGELPDADAVREAIREVGVTAEVTEISDYHFAVFDPPRALIEETFRLNE